jgi:hypothetical protein
MTRKQFTGGAACIILACALVGDYQAQAQNCAQLDCATLNYYGSGAPAQCSGYCNDNTCTVITWSCYMCAPPAPIWCFNADPTKKCCPDVAVWWADCAAGMCSLTCTNRPNTDLQQASCTAMDKTTIIGATRQKCVVPKSGGKCP